MGSNSSASSVSSENRTSDGSDEKNMEMDTSKVTTHGNKTIDGFDEDIMEMDKLHGSGEEVKEMDDSNVDEIKVKLTCI